MLGTLLSVNLRGDLTKLNDRELADGLDHLIERRELVFNSLSNWRTVWNKGIYQTGLGMMFGRGPVRARPFYRLQAFLYAGTTKPGTLAEVYLLDCEIKDYRDEIERRVNARRKT